MDIAISGEAVVGGVILKNRGSRRTAMISYCPTCRGRWIIAVHGAQRVRDA